MAYKTYCNEQKCTQAVWDTNAGGYTCGARVTYLQTALGYSYGAACAQVYSEFPGTCCRTSFCSSHSLGSVISCPNVLDSDNNACFAAMQQDGNLVIYKEGGAVWASNTVGYGAGAPYKLLVQGDGNALVIDSTGNCIWKTDTNGFGAGAPYTLDLRDDCSLVLYDKNYAIIWASNSGGPRSVPDCDVGTCVAIIGVHAPTEGNHMHSVRVNGVESCMNECRIRHECISFILDSATEGGTCKLYSSFGGRGQYIMGGNYSYGRCARPSCYGSGTACSAGIVQAEIPCNLCCNGHQFIQTRFFCK